jgi:1,4-dihydroxy-6-naphthoate synthase
MKTLTLGYSPCPNDTFIFYAMVHGKIDTGEIEFKETLLDVEMLNQKALKGELDITKISYHAFGHLRDNYTLLRSGGALGRGCGPIVVSKNKYAMDDLHGKKIAIPGKLTTASLLLQLYDQAFVHNPDLVIMPFHKILDSIASGEVDAGVIIHESRFTYVSYGLKRVIDLGQWWEKETGLPIPLGGILAKRSLGRDLIMKVEEILRHSVDYSYNNRFEPMGYIKEHSQELSEGVIKDHISLYVNDFTFDLGDEGEKAVMELITRAENAGIIPKSDQSVFI